ncbi:MAG: hypothetical protein GX270_11885 [Clostridiaceae bacterium]|jgi:hypothetical protein|nr:hypothetical protein [Clostridiaceae bacterium]
MINEIKRSEIENEKKILKGLQKKYIRMNENLRQELIALGYTFMQLGCGKSAYMTSMAVAEVSLTRNRKYNRDGCEYLVFGCSNISRRGYPVYRGFVKSIID